jgi:hypothetical protein
MSLLYFSSQIFQMPDQQYFLTGTKDFFLGLWSTVDHHDKRRSIGNLPDPLEIGWKTEVPRLQPLLSLLTFSF